MKKISLLLNVLLVSFILFQSFRSDHAVSGAEVPENTSPLPYNAPDIQLGIDPSLSRKMLEEYRDAIWKSRNINGGVGKDARSVWFSLPKLKAFIREIEEKAGVVCPDSFALGIRIYYGAYPAEPQIGAKAAWMNYFSDHKLPMEYSNHHTVVLVPTYWNNVDGHNHDIDPRFKLADFSGQAASKCSRFASIKDVMGVLLPAVPNPVIPPGIYFDSIGKVARTQSFMLMPDNLDNWRFYRKFELANATYKGRGSDESSSNIPPPPGSDFTNGGTLIPPPYPIPERVTGPTGTGATQPTLSAQRAAMKSYYHIPSSGASYMRWVDNTNDTGWVVRPDINKQEKFR
jgi:hypothetical protein